MKAFLSAYLAAWVVLIAVAALYLGGCASAPKVPAAPPPHHITDTPPSLKNEAKWLDSFAVIGVLAMAAAIATYFLVPEVHQLSISLFVGAASLAGISMLVRESLWLVPVVMWASVSIVGLSLIAFFYEVFVAVKADKPADTAAAIADIPGAVVQVATKIEAAVEPAVGAIASEVKQVDLKA